MGTWYIQRLVETLLEEACSKPAGQEHLSLPDFKVRFSVTMLLQHSNGILTLASSLGYRERISCSGFLNDANSLISCKLYVSCVL